MAGPVEDKGSLTERLDDDRQKMAVQVSELKEDYNVPRLLRGSVQKYPWSWIMGAVLVGFLFSRLPARRKEVYLRSEPSQQGLCARSTLLPRRRTGRVLRTRFGSSLNRLLALMLVGKFTAG
jgi:hypothetical protein